MLHESSTQRAAKFRLRAAERFNISPKKCHIGHIIIEGFLDRPLAIHQIDGATDTYETNLSILLRTMRMADAMRKSGLEPGDKIVIMGPNHVDIAVPFYACQYNGYTLCCMDVSLTVDEIQNTISNCKPKLIFSQSTCAQKVADALDGAKQEAPVVVFDDPNNNLETYIAKYKGTDVNFKPADDFDTSEVIAWLMLSSGTTGTPKLTAFTYDNLLNGVVEWWLQAPPKYERFMALSSLQWISGLMFFISTPIKQFTRLQTSAPISPLGVVMLINKYKPDLTAWTPYVLAQFVRSPEGIIDLSCFKLIMVAGAAADKHIVEQFKKRCPAKLMFSYGMTETLVPIFDNDPDKTPFGSSGKPMRDKYQFKLIDENGNEITESNKRGELWVKGDVFFKEYYNSPEETKNVLSEDGYFKTGDMFYRDDEDYYYFVDRRKALVRYFSDWISPLRIEEVIKQHPGVAEACVVGVPNAETMELAVAAIMPRPGTKIEPQEIFDLIEGTLPDKSQLHGGIMFVESFPMTASGKINRSKLIEIAAKTERILPKSKRT